MREKVSNDFQILNVFSFFVVVLTSRAQESDSRNPAKNQME